MLRSLFSVFVLLPLVALAASAPPATNQAKPIAPPAPALPSVFDVLTFLVHTDGQNHKLIVTSAPTLMRVDLPDEAYSLIYNLPTEHYTGLENANYTYWEFSWPEVRSAVENSKRYSARMQEFSLSGINLESPTAADANPNVPAEAVPAIVPDTSGYVWRQTNDKKTISGLACVKWIGQTVSGDSVQAWCYNGPLPKVLDTMAHLRTINEPMALVAIRSLVPPFVFPIFTALVKGGVTPVQIIWGTDRDKNVFTFVEAKTRPAKPDLFTVPKLYMKTTLVSMDGLIDQKK